MKPRFNYAKVAPGLYEAMDALAAINAWNRLSIAARLTPGGYTPAVSVGA